MTTARIWNGIGIAAGIMVIATGEAALRPRWHVSSMGVTFLALVTVLLYNMWLAAWIVGALRDEEWAQQRPRRRRPRGGYSARPTGRPKPPPPTGSASVYSPPWPGYPYPEGSRSARLSVYWRRRRGGVA